MKITDKCAIQNSGIEWGNLREGAQKTGSYVTLLK